MSYSETTKLAAVELYRKGESSREIAARLGVSHESVLVWCKQRGVEVGPKNFPRTTSLMNCPTNLGLLIRTRRIEAELSQAQLGNLIGCPQSLVSCFEIESQAPRLTHASRLAAALDIPLQDLADAAELDAKEKEGAS